MLVLSRRIGQKMYIGDDVVITILAVSHQGVRLGIEAPKEISVHREEIWERIHNDKKGDVPTECE